MEDNKEKKEIPGVKVEENKEILPDIKNIKQQETYTLPSKGMLYKAEDNIPSAITLRRMTTKEEKMRIRNSSEMEKTRDILQACILNEGVKAENLTLADANFLLFKLRVISLLDDKYKIGLNCPHCGASFIHELNLNEVPVKYIANDVDNLLEVVLPISKVKVKLKIPSLKELINAGNKLDQYFADFPNADRVEAVLSVSQQVYIDTINGHSVMTEEKEEWYNSLDIVDYRKLKSAISKIENIYGFEDNIPSLCPKCNKEVIHGLPITNELFNPSYEDVE